MTLRKAIKGFFNLFTFFTCFGFACCCCVVLMFFPMIIVNFKGVICLTVCYLGVKLLIYNASKFFLVLAFFDAFEITVYVK